jgi:tetratricopeptide (TPR) repeat protein/tRNA A-37 threonylcarbamoyl transferase component Bud32
LTASTGRYEQLDEIAHGAMGTVYRATDTALGREVAVKVLQERFAADSAVARRFVDEARIAGQLQHPGIPPVHDVGAGPDGRPFLVMKLIKGSTLDALLRDRTDVAADRGRFLAAFEQTCQAVAFAHAHQVIHRDLKPANVMVGAFGEVQVMDWGLAKVLTLSQRADRRPDETTGTEIRSLREIDGSETQAGSVLGTPAFMPPEQAVGAVDQVDQRSDVFGLGAILAVILTGSPPFVGQTAESTRVLAARGKVENCFHRLDACGAEPGLVALCKRCLAPDQADRPADAGAVATAVAGLRAESDERARQAELDRVRAEGERAKAEAEAREQRKRRRLQAALGVLLLAAVVLAGFGLWWEERQFAARANEQAAARAAARQRLEGVLDRATAAFQQDRLAEAVADLDRAGELLEVADTSDLRDRYDDVQADRVVVAELDKVWARANAIVDERVPGTTRRSGGLRFDDGAARTGYPAAFAARGLTVGPTNVDASAERIRRSAVQGRLIAALDDWLPIASSADRPWLCDLLARVDPDAGRNAIRRAYVEPDRLKTLFARPPADGALQVAARAAVSPAVPRDQALAVLQAAAVRHPEDFRTHYAAGLRTLGSIPAEAIGHFRAATGLRPDNLAAVYGLGFALHIAGQPKEAASYFLRATELDSGFGSAYLNLADAIKLGADPAPAVAHFQQEIVRKSNLAMAYFGLGMALRSHDPRNAAAAFRRSLALDDTFAMAHNYLGNVLGNLDERSRCYRRAIACDRTFAFPHYNLGGVLRAQGKLREAVAEYREALRLFPEHTFSLVDLAVTLAVLGDRPGAIKHLRRVIEIRPKHHEAHVLLGQLLVAGADWAGAVEHYRACVRRFPTWYGGYNGLVLALCRTGANVEAVRVYREAVFRADATWPEQVWRQLRYNAACAAVLASAGSGRDAPPPADRGVYRQQALDWLRAELAVYQKASASNQPASRAATHGQAQHWLADSDLASTRDSAAAKLLSQAEGDAWNQFWADVRRLHAATGSSPQPAK